MSFDGRAVANFILDRCDANGRPVTNLSLQKIVYFCHVWSLIELNKPLLKQQFEAWKHGPVLQYLYREFKNFDRQPIISRATKLDPVTGQQQRVEYKFDRETEELISKVVNFYSQLSAGQLVDMSHTEGGPWCQVWNHGGSVNPGMKINDKDIVDFYKKSRPPNTLQ